MMKNNIFDWNYSSLKLYSLNGVKHDQFNMFLIVPFKYNFRDIIRTRWNFTLMTEINVRIFGKRPSRTMPFLDALPPYIWKGKSIDCLAEDHRLGKRP